MSAGFAATARKSEQHSEKPRKDCGCNEASGSEAGVPRFLEGLQPKLITGPPPGAHDIAPLPHPALGLQRLADNQAGSRRLRSGVRLSQPGDRYEREADRIADQVMSMPSGSAAGRAAAASQASPGVQRMCAECGTGHSLCAECADQDAEEEELPLLLPKRRPDAATSGVTSGESAATDPAIAPTHGQPLPPDVRAMFEPRFGIDLGGVRLHTGPAAAASARAVGALAYTYGPHLVFGEGQYRPESLAGQHLLAHELTHVLQQSSADPSLQRACDPATLAGRAVPAFFPQEAVLMDVFTGARVLGRGSTERAAIALVQQALVDLNYDLGTAGPQGDGVDRRFGQDTVQGITDFQTAEGIAAATPGQLDESTLRCLDEIRSKRVVPAYQTAVAPSQYRIEGAKPRGRDEDIFFARGSITLTAEAGEKVRRLGATHKGCALTLEGYISEDELVDFGPGLATDRITTVNLAFAAAKHDGPGPSCKNPVPPLRTPLPRPNASSGVGDYRSRRKVEVVPSGQASRTAPCPAGAAQFRSLTPAEDNVLEAAIDTAVPWMTTAIGKLRPGDAEGDAALTAYFGGTGHRDAIKNNLTVWRNHLDGVVRKNNRHGTRCNTACETATAFNHGTGATAQMTVCPSYFGEKTLHSLDKDDTRAFVVMHEAGHGSIDTHDTAYGQRRLIEFLSGYPAIAETNTDSHTLMVLCLTGHSQLCSAPSASDTAAGLSPGEEIAARRGLGWLDTWLIWTAQDTKYLYISLNRSREAGQPLSAVNPYYARAFDTLTGAFGIRRPQRDPPPTFREQTMVAAVRDRLRVMIKASSEGLDVRKDTTPKPSMRWTSGGPLRGPGRKLFLTSSYFTFTKDRERVEALLPLIIAATSSIDTGLKPLYERFVKDNIRVGRGNHP